MSGQLCNIDTLKIFKEYNLQFLVNLITLLFLLTFFLLETKKIFDKRFHPYQECNEELEVVIALLIETYEMKGDENSLPTSHIM